MNPFTLLQHILGSTLSFFYSLIPNYGVAIILLTMLLSLLLFPLTLKQTRSMRAMQELQPEIKSLREELKGDREQLNKRMMELYQERGVSPAAGCLPMLAQLPIWISLYRVLRVGVNASGTGLTSRVIPDGALSKALIEGRTSFLTIDLLKSPASAAASGMWHALPYLVLVLGVIAAGYYQQVQTTRRRVSSGQASGPQQNMGVMMKIMPLFFGLISWSLPTGLVLYFASSSLLRIGQQSFILRLDAPDPDAVPEEEPDADGGEEGDDADRRSGRSPHASKKRKKRRKK